MAGDLDDDGDVDLVSNFNHGATQRRIQLCDGQGNFAPVIIDADVGYTDSTRLLDVDGDGQLELVRDDSTARVVRIDPARNDGTFAPSVELPVEGALIASHLADVDSDGALELIYSTSDDKSLKVRGLGTGGGTWRVQLADSPIVSSSVAPGASGGDGAPAIATNVRSVGVRFGVEFLGEPAGSVIVTLVAPDGQRVALGSHGSFAKWPASSGGTTRYRVQDALTEADVAGLAALHGVQPAGTWRVEIENPTDRDTWILGSTVALTVALDLAQPGATAARPLRLPSGARGRVVRGNTIGGGADASLSCATTTSSADRFYEFSVPVANTVTIGLDGVFDSAIELRAGACATGSAVLACDADSWFGEKSRIAAQPVAAGTYCLVVDSEDGAGTVNHGAYTLFVRLASTVP